MHAAEVARFRSKIVAGPGDEDCSIWIGSIGADGYGLFYITRQGRGLCVRPHRYALALATGEPLGTTLALHECDMPVCVKVAVPQAVRQQATHPTATRGPILIHHGGATSP